MSRRLPYLLAGIAVAALIGVAATLGVVVASDDQPEALIVAPGLGLDADGFGAMMGTGMMGGGLGSDTIDPVESMADAASRADTWLDEAGFDGLRTGEVMQFSNGYYLAVEDGEDDGAFELIVDPATGWIRPEPGPNMMWNTDYGMMRGRDGGGMPGTMMGGGMMDAAPGSPAETVSAEEAEEIANAWLQGVLPGEAAAKPHAFPGYYTLDTERHGRPAAMLSVNAVTGAVWYHAWHGAFLDELEL